jgi:hypothetical protein
MGDLRGAKFISRRLIYRVGEENKVTTVIPELLDKAVL